MAKGSLFVGSGSGKVGNLVLANTKSGQVTRAYQPNVTNPKTKAQMLQRAKFAIAVKFFKQATQNFFKFAYEDKAQNESDYNSYMRHNIKNSLPMSREQYLDYRVPAIGDVFQLSAGRLTSSIVAGFASGSADTLSLNFPNTAAAPATIGDLSKAAIAEGAQTGDIVTIVFISSKLTAAQVQDPDSIPEGSVAPSWYIGQFIVNEEDGTAIADIAHTGAAATIAAAAVADGGFNLTVKVGGTVLGWGSVVITRNTDSALYATNSYLVANEAAVTLAENLQTDGAVENALVSWKSNGTAILKGSIANG